MRIRRTVVPALLLAAASLTACGGDEDSSAEDGPTAPAATSGGAEDGGDVAACDLLTTDEVGAAVGSPVKKGIARSGAPITGGRFTSCLWQSDDPENPGDQAQLYLYSNAAAADSVREDDSPEVPGIGDEAFTQWPAAVWVYQGEQSFMAQWYTFSGSEEENLPKSEALAKAASEKLG